MSLYPGAPRQVGGTFKLDEVALQDSMALAMDETMKQLFKDVKGRDMPDTDREDRWILFTAIARGILQYLSAHQGALRAQVAVDGTASTFTVQHFDLAVSMDSFTPDP